MELSYSIDSWDRLTECRSNKSSEYYIVVRDVNCGSYMRAKMIHVHHSKLGCVFATTVGAMGTIVDSDVPDMTREDILKQLKRFGFNVKFSQKIDIPERQLYKLRGLYDLGYDRIRLISLQKTNGSVGYVVAFKSTSSVTDDWFNNWYSPYESEFDIAVRAGEAYVVHSTSNNDGEDWSWVHGAVYKLQDLLSMYQAELYSLDRRNMSENNKDDKAGLGLHPAGQFILKRFLAEEK